MFDIGLLELLVIAAISLLVVGPERMPHMIRHLAAWIKRIRSFISSVQQDIEKEIQVDELKQTLESVKQAQAEHIKPLVTQQQATNTLKQHINNPASTTQP